MTGTRSCFFPGLCLGGDLYLFVSTITPAIIRDQAFSVVLSKLEVAIISIFYYSDNVETV